MPNFNILILLVVFFQLVIAMSVLYAIMQFLPTVHSNYILFNHYVICLYSCTVKCYNGQECFA